MGYTNRKINDDSWLIQCDSHVSMYLIEGTEKAMLIDAGMERDNLAEYCRGLTEKPVFCVLTHGHFDHIGRCGEFAEGYLDLKDKELYKQHSSGPFLKEIDPCCKDAEELLEMQKEFDLGSIQVVSISVPGHTSGSVVFCDRKNHTVYCGDAIGSGCGVLMTAGLGSLPLKEYAEGLKQAIMELEDLGVDDEWKFYGGHYGQHHASRISDHNLPCLQMMKDMRVLCEQMEEGNADIQESIKESPFGKAKEIIGIYGCAELQLLADLK